MDDQHPMGASHHQKIVVVDDKVAFVGGLDLTRCRWDTPEHAPHDPRRCDNGSRYAPFHDVAARVSGSAAAALGQLARERWHRATGETIPPDHAAAHAASDDSFCAKPTGTATLSDIQVAIARTEPAFQNRPEVREVEAMLVAAIGAAQRCIYIENQYLTSSTIGSALAQCLAEANGPDVVIVLPEKTGGWLEQTTMDVLRARLLRRLRQARYSEQRLKVYYPYQPSLESDCIIVHAKLAIIDDQLLIIGSANLSNRSMGFDTECNLAVHASDCAGRQAIQKTRQTLLAEHLDLSDDSVEQLTQAVNRGERLVPLIERLRSDDPQQRSLRSLDAAIPDAVDALVPDAALIDPEKPLSARDLTRQLLLSEASDIRRTKSAAATNTPQHGRNRWRTALLALLALLILAGAWRWTPLAEWLDRELVVAWLETLRASGWGSLFVLTAFVCASLIAFPITLLIITTGIVFGPVWGYVYSLSGVLLGACAGYGVGHWLGRRALRRMVGARLNAVSQQLVRRGVLAVAVVRNLPLAPFTLVNFIAGASQLSLRDFLLGTLIGMAPGMLLLVLFADSVTVIFKNPQPADVAISLSMLATVAVGAYALQRWLNRRAEKLDQK